MNSKKTVVLNWKRSNQRKTEGHPTGPRTVSWTINGDGTATCQEDGLMWIQAPWGMQWNGYEFTGSPLLFSWVEAKEQFGCGVRVGLAEDGTIGLSASQFRSTAVEFGYVGGSRSIFFAGYGDWRLATLADWYTLLGLEREGGDIEKRNTVLQLGQDQDYWTANERYEPRHDWKKLNKLTEFFTGPKYYVAWSANVGRWLMDKGVEERLPIMLVRDL